MANVSGGQISWVVDADSSKFDASLDKASADAKSFGDNLQKSGSRAASNFGSEFGSAFDSIGAGLGRLVKGFAVAGAAGSVGFGSMIKAAFDQQVAVENARFALRAYEGDASKVNAVLSDLVKFATSPLGVLFQREELFKAASNLKVYGDETTKLTDHIKIMSRAVALGFTSFDELSQILGRVGAAGKLTGVDFDVLTARGIKLPDTMRNAAVSFDDLFRAVSNAIPEGVLEGRANSIEGRLIRLKSSFRNLGASILGINRDTNEFVEGGLGDKMLKLLDNLRITLGSPEIKTAFTELGKSVAAFAERALPLLIKGLEFIARNITNIAPAFVALAVAWAAASAAGIVLGIVFGPITLGAFLIAAAITGLIAVITFLQLKFDIFKKTLDTIKTVAKTTAETLSSAFDKVKDVVTDLVDDSLKFLKDRIDDVRGAFKAVQRFIDDHYEGLKQIAGIITVVLGPAFVKLGVKAVVTGAQMAVAAGVAAAQWVAQAAVAAGAWTVQFTVMSAKAVAHTVVSSAQAVIAGLRWAQAAAGVAASWVTQFAIMSAKATATAVIFTAQASIAGYAWIVQSVRAAAAWLIAFPGMVVAATVTAARFVVQATIAGTAWVVQATRATIAWLIAFPRMAIGAFSTAATFVAQALIGGGAWVIQALRSGAAWILAFIQMTAGAIVAGTQMALAAVKTGVAWLVALGPIGLVIAGIIAIATAAFLVIKNWDKVKDFFGAIGGFVLRAIGNLGKILFNAGKDLIQGLLDGAGSLLSKIAQFMVDKLPSAIQGPFKKALGISSPSKVFAGYGQNITEGLIQGIQGGQSMLDGAMKGLTTDIVGPTIAPNLITDNATDSIGSAKGKLEQNNTFNVYNQVDLTQGLRDLAWQLGN